MAPGSFSSDVVSSPGVCLTSRVVSWTPVLILFIVSIITGYII